MPRVTVGPRARAQSPILRAAPRRAALDVDEAGAAGDAASVLRRTLDAGAGDDSGSPRRAAAGAGDVGAAAAAAVPSTACFGHSGLGGSLAFGDARSGMGVAITLTQLSSTKETTGAIVRMLAAELGLEAFTSF